MDFIAVVGPTASGKSAAAMEIATHLSGEIVCCDSVQLYRGFKIGAASPSEAELRRVPHHLFGVLDPYDDCDAALYAHRAKDVIREIKARNKVPVVTGGTGLYLRALMNDRFDPDLPKDQKLRELLQTQTSEELYAELVKLDPRRAKDLHPNDRFRVIRALEIVRITGKPVPVSEGKSIDTPRNCVIVRLDPPRAVLHDNIALRTKAMLDGGLLEEVSGLLRQGVSSKPMQSIGYFEAAKHLAGELTFNEMQAAIEASTRQYAKRQCTWFKKIEADFCLSRGDAVGECLENIKNLFLNMSK
jgi:tRNA dimethylallyltransferase